MTARTEIYVQFDKIRNATKESIEEKELDLRHWVDDTADSQTWIYYSGMILARDAQKFKQTDKCQAYPHSDHHRNQPGPWLHVAWWSVTGCCNPWTQAHCVTIKMFSAWHVQTGQGATENNSLPRIKKPATISASLCATRDENTKKKVLKSELSIESQVDNVHFVPSLSHMVCTFTHKRKKMQEVSAKEAVWKKCSAPER